MQNRSLAGRMPDRELYRPGKRVWDMVSPFLWYLLIELVTEIGVMIVITFPQMLPLYQTVAPDQWMEAAIDLVTVALMENLFTILLITYVVGSALFFFLRSRDRRREKAWGIFREYRRPDAPFMVLVLILGAALSLMLNNLLVLSNLSNILEDTYSPVAEQLYRGDLWVELVVLGLCGPVYEEVLFRGMIQHRMRWSFGKWPTVVLSALFFGLVHGNLLQGIYAFLVGFVLAYAYEATQSIFVPILIHVGANLISVIMTETTWLDFLYSDDTVFLITTFAALLAFLGLAYYLLTHWRLQEIPAAPLETVSPQKEEI